MRRKKKLKGREKESDNDNRYFKSINWIKRLFLFVICLIIFVFEILMKLYFVFLNLWNESMRNCKYFFIFCGW